MKIHSLLRLSSFFIFTLCILGCEGTRPIANPAKIDIAEGDWATYLGDKQGSHFSPLTEVTRDNVAELEVAWRYDSESVDADAGLQLQTNPLIVDGVLYGLTPTLKVFALDAASGRELWRFETPRTLSLLPNPGRGLALWPGNETAAPRLLVTADSYLYALNLKTGKTIDSFGDDGRVDLRQGFDDKSPKALSVNATSPGALFDDLLILGSRVSEFGGASPGDIRAYSVISGERAWVFKTIPDVGEAGSQSWPENARERSGGANSWAGMTVDEARGMVFAPTGSATFDFYGGDREGDNLYANSLLALDARTGKRIWHQQIVRHDLWDRDLPAPPNLITLHRDGRTIEAVAQVTKTGHIFVFERDTGKPVFPLAEVPVLGQALPGEHASASQPIPTMLPPFTRQHLGLENLSRRTPFVADIVRRKYGELEYSGLYTLPSLRGTLVYPGIDGGAEWGGAAWDAASQTLYINANEVPYVIQMVAGAATEKAVKTPRAAYLMGCSGCHGVDLRGDGLTVPPLIDLSERMGPLDAYRIARDGRGRMPANEILPWYGLAAVIGYIYLVDEQPDDAPVPESGSFEFINAGWQKFVDPDGLPASAPPWGTLTAIDLSTASIKWRLPLGDYPKALAMGYQGLGAENYGGPVVTAGGLVFIGATPDAKFRAFDAETGNVLWETQLPAAAFATPAVYRADGRQYIVVAAGGGKLGQPSAAQYIAFALPETTTSPPR